MISGKFFKMFDFLIKVDFVVFKNVCVNGFVKYFKVIISCFIGVDYEVVM